MTLDTQLHDSFASAVDDTTVPPGLAHTALAGGRKRQRRRRLAVGGGLVAAALVGGALTQLPDSPSAREGQVADFRGESGVVALKWARSLPQGEAPSVPFFGEGGLWSDGQMYDAPDEVNYAYPPREVAGGWLVLTGHDEERLGLAVMAPDMSLRDLPGSDTFAQGFGDARVEVSADGRRVAYGSWLVDVTTMQLTPVPHRPESDEQDGYYTAIRMVGFTDDGLVYEGAPFDKGFGTTWLLRDDGTTTQVDPPEGSHIGDGVPADEARSFDYAADNSDTCVTSYVLRAGAWSQQGYGCMGHYLGEALTVSPDRQWLITDDLPEVWNLQEGAWHSVDLPEGVGKAQMDAQMGGIVWESADSFLLPVADQWSGMVSPEPEFDQRVQVVRCTMSTGQCERAGEEQYIRVTSTMWGNNELRFATT